ncbi:MAG: DUF3081 domain-containing protein [Cellvibrionaceae bacterium]|nr:DUF3081 domain-containing protein [Cellvibrionaceae bacterium]
MSNDDKISIKKALRVFQKILDSGEKTDSEFRLNGLRASTDFDGYAVTLRNDYVCLDIFFHNKFAFKYSNQRERDLFLDKLDQIDAKQ